MKVFITLQRLRDDGEATLGHISAGIFHCFSLEDQAQKIKVAGETRIPAGKYQIVKREHGRFYETYKRKLGFPCALELKDVPGFTDILIHTGNVDDHTAGCVLVGLTGSFTDRAQVGASYAAYKRLWAWINANLNRGSEVWIVIKDEDLGVGLKRD